MRYKTAYIGLKVEPALKREVISYARKARVHPSTWIREAIILKIKQQVGERKTA